MKGEKRSQEVADRLGESRGVGESEVAVRLDNKCSNNE